MTRRYKWAKAYRGKTGDPNEEWYAFYSFIDPNTGKFERFKVKEGINYIHDLAAKEKYMKELLKEIDTKLEAGYDPFGANEIASKIVHEIKAEQHLAENLKSPLLMDAFMDFLNNKRGRDLAKATMQSYEGYISRFEYYLQENKLLDVRLDTIDTKFIGDMLDWLKPVQKWEGTTYNNHLNFWVTLLNWFAKKPRYWVNREDFLIGNDGELEQKITRPMKHQYFGDTVGLKVRELLVNFPALNFYCQFIYFSCMRPDEIRNLQIENVDITGRYIKIVGKTKSRTVPICDELAEMLHSLGLHRYPLNYYVIGKQGEVSDIMHSESYFSKSFLANVRQPLGLSDNFTPYGFKHTRVVDLLNAGYNDAEVQNLTGHRDTASYDKYKRDLIGHLETRLRGKTIGWAKKD